MKRVAVVIALAASLLMAGCTSPSTSKTAAAVASTASRRPTLAPQSATTPTIASVTDTLGITDYKRDSDATPFTAEWGEATYQGKKVKIYRFDSDTEYRGFLKYISAYGASASWLVKDGLIAVSPDDQTQLPAIKKALGE